jgi:NADPH2:quinone reductase
MRAVSIIRLDGPLSMEMAEVPDPVPAESQVLIEVHAAGVTYPDVLQSRGTYQIKPELPFTPGGEVAGIVRAAPAGSSFSVGDRVAAFPGLGGFAEKVTVDANMVFPLPDGLTLEQGAALPMNMLTSHFALVTRGRLQPGETVLVHGAAGGIGTAAVQLAHALGARVIAVVSTPEKGEVARLAGAEEVVAAESFLADVKDLTSGKGVDLVVDPVGGDRFTDSLRSLAPEGRLLVIGFTGGEIPVVRVNRLLLNNISVIGVGWGSFLAQDPGLPVRQWSELMELLEQDKLQPPATLSYPLEEAGLAVGQLDRRAVLGKILLRVR